MEYQKITSYNLYRIKEDIDLTENKFISDTRHAVYIDHYPMRKANSALFMKLMASELVAPYFMGAMTRLLPLLPTPLSVHCSGPY